MVGGVNSSAPRAPHSRARKEHDGPTGLTMHHRAESRARTDLRIRPPAGTASSTSPIPLPEVWRHVEAKRLYLPCMFVSRARSRRTSLQLLQKLRATLPESRPSSLISPVGSKQRAGEGVWLRDTSVTSATNQRYALPADKPTSNLDEQTEREIMEMLREIHASTAVMILMVTHTSQLIPYGRRALQMAGGMLRSEPSAS